MNKFFRLVLLCAFGALAIHQALCYAESITKNGVTYRTWETKDARYASIPFMTAVNPGTATAIYNNAAESAIESGAVNVSKFNDDITIQVYIPTLGSTGLDIVALGRFGTNSQWGEIETKSFSAVTTLDYVLDVAVKPEYLRVSAQATGTEGADLVSVHALCKEKRVSQ